MKNYKTVLALATLEFVLFIVFTSLVKSYDLADIGVYGTSVGFSTINQAFKDFVGYNHTMYIISEITGYMGLATGGFFALVGIRMLSRAGSFKGVDYRILILGFFYVFVIGVYFVFEKIHINYRPIIIDGVVEESYPSSHTLMSLCIFLTAQYQANWLLKYRKGERFLYKFGFFLIMVTCVGARALSGVHWLTDIVGSIILSVSLRTLYKAFVLRFEEL